MSRAVRYSEFGAPEVLDVVDVEEPQAGPGQVRVAVRAAGLNPYDYKVRRGGYGPPRELPSGQGSEFAGIVDQVADDVTGVAVGDEVLGWTSFAAQAEYVVVPATSVAPKPPGLDWVTAAGIGLVGNTAKRTADSLELAPSDTVLVTGAAGGVGLLSAQFALDAGATVIGTASEQNHDFLRGLGVIPVAYGDGLAERLCEAAPQGITAVLDTIGKDQIELALSLGVKPERINSIAYHPGAEEFGIRVVGGGSKTATELADLAERAADGRLALPILATYPLTQVVQAYERLEAKHGLGKIVLTIP